MGFRPRRRRRRLFRHLGDALVGEGEVEVEREGGDVREQERDDEDDDDGDYEENPATPGVPG
jgi:hypothetical protein